MSNINFSAVELMVRTGDKADNIELISCYIQIGLERAKSMKTLADTKNTYLRLYHTLLETMCDSFLTVQWRQFAFSYIKQMMPILLEVCEKKEFQRIRTEVNTFSQYFLQVSERYKSNV